MFYTILQYKFISIVLFTYLYFNELVHLQGEFVVLSVITGVLLARFLEKFMRVLYVFIYTQESS